MKPTPAAQARFVTVVGWLFILPALVGSVVTTLESPEHGKALWTACMGAMMGAPCFIFSFLNGTLLDRVLAAFGSFAILLAFGSVFDSDPRRLPAQAQALRRSSAAQSGF